MEEADVVIIKENNLNIRHLEQSDNYLLAKWLSDPSVLEYYEGRDNPFDLEKVNQKFYHSNDHVQRCILEYSRMPIGYIQFYLVDDKNEYSANEVIYGMDQFIGETEYWNKGIGTLMIRVMVSYLVEKWQADRIIMDPQVSNERALKCYEKCGFKKVKILLKHEFHEGKYRDCWLIEFKPP